MNRPKILKLVHFYCTAWFLASTTYLLVLALLKPGNGWLVIISLSGYSTLIALLLISLYLFAFLRNIVRTQKIKEEHPLTTSIYYFIFYNTNPILGSLGGALAAIGSNKISYYLQLIAAGCLFTTFLVLIVIDPLVGFIEMLLPSSLRHRLNRLADAKMLREKELSAKQHLLNEMQNHEQQEHIRWQKALLPYANKLASSLANLINTGKYDETEAIEIGLNAWHMGGLSCMQQLHDMVMDTYKQKNQHKTIVDYLSICWDGIGNWRNEWPAKTQH